MEVTGTRLAPKLSDTEALAREFADWVTGGTCFLLNGDLGAGKTAFTKALFFALGVRKVVTSPTFNLVKEYQGKFSLYHMDLYRLEGNDYEELGLEEYFTDDAVVVIEWNKLPKIEMPVLVEMDVEVRGEERLWKWNIKQA